MRGMILDKFETVDGASCFIPDHVTSKRNGSGEILSRFPTCPGVNALPAERALQKPEHTSGFSNACPVLAETYRKVRNSGVLIIRG